MNSRRLEDYGDVLLAEEAFAVLKIGRQAGYEAIRQGAIPSLRFGRRIVVPKEQLRKLLAGESEPTAA